MTADEVPPSKPATPRLRAGVGHAWRNVVGVVVLAITAVSARSVALAGFGLDSLIEIGASIVVIWELCREPVRRGSGGRCG
jgi:hypothetical protein